MAIQKLSTASLKNPQWYRSASAVSKVPAAFSLDYLVIGGGGGGGGRNIGGGGGAGGYRTSFGTSGGGASAEAALITSTYKSLTVTVGAGGNGGAQNVTGSSGSNSVFDAITALGGGGGGTGETVALSGGSGGGGGASSGGSGTNGQGYRGGNQSGAGGSNYPYTWRAAGGGGAGGQGADGSLDSGGRAGGSGVASTITGTSVTRAGGGGGAGSPSVGGDGGSGGGGNGASMGQPYSGPERPATAGTVNTGSGGGGGGTYQNFSDAAAGGSGIVIVRYSDTYQLEVGSGLTHSTVNVNGFNITSFTAGTGNVMFTPIQTSPYAYELLESVVLGGSQASVTFSNLNAAYGSEYQHLQIRMTARASRPSSTTDPLIIQLNGSTQNYSHVLYGNGSSATSGGVATQYSLVDAITGTNAATDAFGACIIDILDPFELNKNKVLRALTGANTVVTSASVLYTTTSVTTSISLTAFSGTNFLAGSRFSLYGIKAS